MRLRRPRARERRAARDAPAPRVVAGSSSSGALAALRADALPLLPPMCGLLLAASDPLARVQAPLAHSIRVHLHSTIAAAAVADGGGGAP